MARGDVVWFNEALEFMLDGGFEAADDLKLAICDNTVAPTQTTATPALADFTQVGSAGNYVSGGTSLGTLSACVTVSGAVMTFDSTVNPTWAANAGNDTDAYWGVGYNDTDAGKRALFYVDLGGPVNMATSALTVTWNASGIMTITNT
jgi:hypothetical protein